MNGLHLRTVTSAEDVEKVAAFDGLIHGATMVATCRAWMTEHPHAGQSSWLFIEEEATGRVAAALCLLPWRFSYAGIELRSGEMGVVGTLEEYRGRGLQRALNVRFDELLRARGDHLSHIQGIPYFYRQFGYEYALPLEAWWRLELHMAPQEPQAGCRCRLAVAADLPELIRRYDEAALALDVAALRDEATWRYLLGPGLPTETGAETWMLEDAEGVPAGYFRIAHTGFGAGLIVAEASLMTYHAALTALATIRALAAERGKPFIRMNLPADTPLVAAACSLGGYDGGVYAWQVRLPDPAALLRVIAPALEQRLAQSIYAGLSREVILDLYRERLALRFADGRLMLVATTTGDATNDLRLPPKLLAPLILGHRSLHELTYIYPDAYAVGSSGALIDTLFPKLRSWLYQPY